LAIDINPRYNPYVIYGDEGIRYCVPEEALPYADRDAAYPYKIAAGDLCCRLFRERGFRWGGDWTGHPDYMHFSKTEFAEES
ncbi:MAG: M15 family metallopeptidase, partial [Lachnospiraceae bacterium]